MQRSFREFALEARTLRKMQQSRSVSGNTPSAPSASVVEKADMKEAMKRSLQDQKMAEDKKHWLVSFLSGIVMWLFAIIYAPVSFAKVPFNAWKKPQAASTASKESAGSKFAISFADCEAHIAEIEQKRLQTKRNKEIRKSFLFFLVIMGCSLLAAYTTFVIHGHVHSAILAEQKAAFAAHRACTMGKTCSLPHRHAGAGVFLRHEDIELLLPVIQGRKTLLSRDVTRLVTMLTGKPFFFEPLKETVNGKFFHDYFGTNFSNSGQQEHNNNHTIADQPVSSNMALLALEVVIKVGTLAGLVHTIRKAYLDSMALISMREQALA